MIKDIYELFSTMPNIKRTRYGYMGNGQYIRVRNDRQGIYTTTDDVRFGWRLVSCTENAITKYYLLHTYNEQIEYVGKSNAWAHGHVKTKEQYVYTDNASGEMREVETYDKEFITGEKRRPLSGSLQRDINGEMHMITYAYYGVSRNKGKDFYSKDAYVCEYYLCEKYAICNNNHHIILDGLKRVKLSDDNIAEVVFMGEEKTTWVNLYTMQEFDEQPTIEHMGFMELLKVGNKCYFYKNRQMAGIPVEKWTCAVNDRVFLFLDQYVILKEQPNKIYYVDGELRKGNQWYLKLCDLTDFHPMKWKKIPSAWLPRKD